MMQILKSGKASRKIFSVGNIRIRLLLIMLVLMFVSLSLLTGLSYYFSNRALSKSVNETAAAIGLDYSNRVSSFIDEMGIYVQNIALNPHIVAPTGRQQIVETLASALQRNDKFTGINYGDLDGNVIRAQGDTAYLGDREYYQKAVRTEKMAISEPLISKGSGRLSLAIAVPVITQGQMTGIIQATIPLESLDAIVKDIKFKSSGYGFILDQSGVIIAHATKPELNGKMCLVEKNAEDNIFFKVKPEENEKLPELFDKVMHTTGQTVGSYKLSDTTMFTIFTPIYLRDGSHWLVAVSAPLIEVNQEVVDLNKILMAAAIFCIVLGIAVVLLISTRFARPEEKYLKAFRYVADVIGIVNLETECFIEANDAFFKILGYGRDEVIGHTSEEFGLWAKNEKCKLYNHMKEHKSIYNFETVWLTRDGRLRTGIFSADVVEMGKEICAVFIWHDITEQKAAEIALKKAYEEMEQTVEMRTQELFAANQELTAMNQEMIAINEELENTNESLHQENYMRQATEDKLLLRERQYRATTNLLTRPDYYEAGQLAEMVLNNAMQLVKASYGFIGRYDVDGSDFTIHYGIGIGETMIMHELPVLADGPLHEVYQSGQVFQSKDYWWHRHLRKDHGVDKETRIVFVPLKQDNQVKGILAATWVDEIEEVCQEDIEVLCQFADLAFLAMERTRIQKQVRHMAFYDMLTDLPNRVSLNQRLAEELEKARQGEGQGIVLFIDLDDFKAINDTFGHSAGDKVIVKAANYLREAFSETGFVSRISGDEFVVIVPGEASISRASQVAGRALSQVCQEYDLQEAQVQMSASIGVVIYPKQGDQPDEILKKADAAMYSAKDAGRNCWRFFEPSLLDKTAADMLMINALRHALVTQKEFFLQYQPQLTTDGRRIVGVESLLRWQSKEFGLVPPANFIALAERGKLIVEIGQMVFRKACQFAQTLAKRKIFDVRVAVNVSPRQIKDVNFVTMIQSIIAEYGVKPGQIEIEVTENVFIDNLEDSILKLKQLQKYGVTLALDDFGTGFSSLTYLRRLPVNYLKIDKSFIDKIGFEDLQLQFVESIIKLGHTLGIEIIAEGVENDEQLKKLENCRCDYIQGYVFSRPVSEENALNLLAGRNEQGEINTLN